MRGGRRALEAERRRQQEEEVGSPGYLRDDVAFPQSQHVEVLRDRRHKLSAAQPGERVKPTRRDANVSVDNVARPPCFPRDSHTTSASTGATHAQPHENPIGWLGELNTQDAVQVEAEAATSSSVRRSAMRPSSSIDGPQSEPKWHRSSTPPPPHASHSGVGGVEWCRGDREVSSGDDNRSPVSTSSVPSLTVSQKFVGQHSRGKHGVAERGESAQDWRRVLDASVSPQRGPPQLALTTSPQKTSAVLMARVMEAITPPRKLPLGDSPRKSATGAPRDRLLGAEKKRNRSASSDAVSGRDLSSPKGISMHGMPLRAPATAKATGPAECKPDIKRTTLEEACLAATARECKTDGAPPLAKPPAQDLVDVARPGRDGEPSRQNLGALREMDTEGGVALAGMDSELIKHSNRFEVCVTPAAIDQLAKDDATAVRSSGISPQLRAVVSPRSLGSHQAPSTGIIPRRTKPERFSPLSLDRPAMPPLCSSRSPLSLTPALIHTTDREKVATSLAFAQTPGAEVLRDSHATGRTSASAAPGIGGPKRKQGPDGVEGSLPLSPGRALQRSRSRSHSGTAGRHDDVEMACAVVGRMEDDVTPYVHADAAGSADLAPSASGTTTEPSRRTAALVALETDAELPSSASRFFGSSPPTTPTEEDEAADSFDDTDLLSVPVIPASRSSARRGCVVASGRQPKPKQVNCSGFYNSGNACYACSVLTLLLRNTIFSKSLQQFLSDAVLMKLAEKTAAQDDGESVSGKALTADSNSLKSSSSFKPTARVSCRSTGDEEFRSATNIPSTAPVLLSSRDLHQAKLRLHRALKDILDLLVDSDSIDDGIDMDAVSNLFSPEAFFNGGQQDAHEFLVAVIDMLEEEAVAFLKRHQHVCRIEGGCCSACRGDEGIWVNQMIQGNMLNVIRCAGESCGHTIVTLEPFIIISLALPTPTTTLPSLESGMEEAPKRSTAATEVCTMQQLIEKTVEQEKLDDYVCDSCKTADSTYQFGYFFSDPPPLLFAQLKRFTATYDPLNGSLDVTKNCTPVRLQKEITLRSVPARCYDGNKGCLARPYCTWSAEALPARARAPDNEEVPTEQVPPLLEVIETRYRLVSTVLHLGERLNTGHYVAHFTVPASSGRPSAHEGSATCRKRMREYNNKADSTASNGNASMPRSDGPADLLWYMANDEAVFALHSEAVNEAHQACPRAYLLLYEKVSQSVAWLAADVLTPKLPPQCASPAEAPGGVTEGTV